MRGKAAITRSGVFEYRASELGVGGDEIVKVYRPQEAIFNQDTIASLRGAAITIDHPENGVAPDNWRSLVVGNIVGEPAAIDTDRLGADILIGDKSAIDRIDGGESELSIGYTFQFDKVDDKRLGYDFKTIGHLDINHVAVVKRGRAGANVRVFDAVTTNDGDFENMTKEEIQEMLRKTVADALPNSGNGKNAPDASAIASAVMAGLTPVIDEMRKVVEDTAKREQEAKAADSKKKAEEAADKLINATVAQERERAVLFADALPLIPEEKREAMKSADVKDFLIAAIGDSIAIPEGASIDFLKGAFASLKKDRNAAKDNWQLSAGAKTTGTGEVNQARDEIVKNLGDAYKGEAAGGKS